MSRIARISLASHVNDLGGKLWNPAIRWTQKHAVFVVIEDDLGHVGLGECWCFDTAPDALLAFLRTEVLPHFIGAELSDAEELTQRLVNRATLTARHGMLASALSGIDLAVWDIRARHAELPLWRLLNPQGSGAVALYASGGLYGQDKTTDDLTREMAGYEAQGFGLSKMKIGGLSISEDLARVRAVLAALPPEARLIIDGVYSYTADQARRIYESLPEGRIEAFQSPVRAHDLDGMAALSRANVPVMALEAEYRREMHELLVHKAQVAFLQTAPIASGGVAGVRALADLCTETDTQLSLEVSSTGLALMAACHLAASEPLVAHVEYHMVHQVFFDEFDLQPPQFSPLTFALPDTPGLGVSLPAHAMTAAKPMDAPVASEEPRKQP
ncbi:MAG: mandelate racemase/muconate lactonizing enzyme family protein [Celeribacter sp.]